MRYELPYAAPGQVIGLLGGSFDPAHEGHLHITKEAMKRFRLHRVWWLVSPGNPLKATGPAAMDLRMERARDIVAHHPRIEVTDIEARIGTRYTAQTIAKLQQLYPHVRFVWLMGADNLVQFDQWQDWRDIMESVPVGVLARPKDRVAACTSKAAQLYWQRRIRRSGAYHLGQKNSPAWAFVNIPMNSSSSTQIRKRGEWIASD